MTDLEIREVWFENMINITMGDGNHTIEDVKGVVSRACDRPIEDIKQDMRDNDWATEEELK